MHHASDARRDEEMRVTGVGGVCAHGEPEVDSEWVERERGVPVKIGMAPGDVCRSGWAGG